MPAPLISVIIPAFNRKDLLKKAIDSVLAQTRQDFELIVVDDGSTDGTAEFIEGYWHEYGSKIVLVRQKNRGPAAARNMGIKAAAGDLLAFLDSDDLFDKKKLAIQAAAMIAEPSCLISHTNEIWYRRGILLNQKKKHAKAGGFIFARCLELCVVGMSTVMVRRALFEQIGFFDEDFLCCEDYDFWLRASVKQSFLLIDRPPLTFKAGGREDQVSFRHRRGMDRFRIKAILKILASGLLSADQAGLAKVELVRKCVIYGNGCLKRGRREEGLRYLAIPATYGFN